MARFWKRNVSKNVAPRMSLHIRIRRNAPAPAGEEAVEPEAQGE